MPSVHIEQGWPSRQMKFTGAIFNCFRFLMFIQNVPSCQIFIQNVPSTQVSYLGLHGRVRKSPSISILAQKSRELEVGFNCLQKNVCSPVCVAFMELPACKILVLMVAIYTVLKFQFTARKVKE